MPVLEQAHDAPFEEIPVESIPVLGVIVGGFSHGAFLSEVWHIVIPTNSSVGSASQDRASGAFGSNWYAMYEPIRRYFKGFDLGLLFNVSNWLLQARGVATLDQQPLTQHRRTIRIGARDSGGKGGASGRLTRHKTANYSVFLRSALASPNSLTAQAGQ